MRKSIVTLTFILALCVSASAQYSSSTARRVQSGASLPATCISSTVIDVFIKTGSSAGFYYCSATNTWTGPLPTTVTAPGGSSGDIQYNNAGAFGGVGSTGTGNVVRSASPALTGTPSAPSLSLTGTGGLGFTEHIAQSSNPPAPASGFRLFANSAGKLSFVRSDGFVRAFDAGSVAAHITWTMPNTSATIARTDAGQTFTGNQVINGNITFTDDTYDIGASGATRPRNIFVTRDITANGSFVTAGGVGLGHNGTAVVIGNGSWPVQIAGNSILMALDNIKDFGASASGRPRTGYFGTSVVTPKFCYSSTVCDSAGAGSPEGVVTAGIGSTYRNTTDGSFYRKTSGTGNMGWTTP